MAKSDSFSGNILNGNYTLRVDWSAAQNTTSNTSKITATMYLVQASGWPLDISARDNYITINGKDYDWTSPKINKADGTTKLATVTSDDITHNTDGTKSVTISATFYIRFTRISTGVYYEKITATATVSLDAIPRGTVPTLSASSAYMGETVTINTPRASSNFTHDLAYQFAGGSWGAIATGVTTSTTWTVPDLSSQIPNASSGVVTIRCITKSGSTTIGTTTVSLTVKVPTNNDDYPTVTAITLTEADTIMAERFENFVQGKSRITANITAVGAKGSTVTSISSTFRGVTYSGSTWTTGVINDSGTFDLDVTVTDSRGRRITVRRQVEVLAYYKPQVTLFEVTRVKDPIEWDTEPDGDGAFALVHYAYSVPQLGGWNSAEVVVEYKETTADTWTELRKDTYTGEDLAVGELSFCELTPFSTDVQYDFRITVEDYFEAQTLVPALLPSGDVIIDILADGTGIGIGTTATLPNVCDIKMQTRLQGGTMGVFLPEGTNFDELMTPGRYVTGNLLDTTYSGVKPFDSGTFDLDVVAAGPEGQLKQVATYCTKQRVQTRTRFYHSGGWGPWVESITTQQKILWDGRDLDAGGSHMNGTQKAELVETIREQEHGIVLVFCLLATTTENGAQVTKATDSDIFSYFVPKQSINTLNGQGHTFLLMSGNFSNMARKYLYIYDDKITGDATNTSKGTTNGISYDNSKFVLRYVYGV